MPREAGDREGCQATSSWRRLLALLMLVLLLQQQQCLRLLSHDDEDRRGALVPRRVAAVSVARDKGCEGRLTVTVTRGIRRIKRATRQAGSVGGLRVRGESQRQGAKGDKKEHLTLASPSLLSLSLLFIWYATACECVWQARGAVSRSDKGITAPFAACIASRYTALSLSHHHCDKGATCRQVSLLVASRGIRRRGGQGGKRSRCICQDAGGILREAQCELSG